MLAVLTSDTRFMWFLVERRGASLADLLGGGLYAWVRHKGLFNVLDGRALIAEFGAWLREGARSVDGHQEEMRSAVRLAARQDHIPPRSLGAATMDCVEPLIVEISKVKYFIDALARDGMRHAGKQGESINNNGTA